MSSDLKKALMADASPLSLLALARIENLEDFINEVDKKISNLCATIDLLEDRSFPKVVAPNIDCILALETAGMMAAASVLRRMK